MKRLFVHRLLVISLLSVLPGFRSVLADSTARFAKAVSLLSSSAYFQEISWWAADERKGREPGTPESYQAAQRAADFFRSLGLEPAGTNGTYFQPFEEGGKRVVEVSKELTVNGRSFRYGRDWTLVAGPERCALKKCPVVFAGYGITERKLGYDDWRGVNPAGAAALVLRYEPQEIDPTSRWNGAKPTRGSSLVYKVNEAQKHKARALLLVNGPLHHDPASDPLLPFGSVGRFRSAIPFIHINEAVASSVLEPSGRMLLELQNEIDMQEHPLSFRIPQTVVSFDAASRLLAPARNVVSMLRGSDPRLRHEVVVLGAHYDHIGLGFYGSRTPSRRGEVHNGADDNASGTTGVLELAGALVHSGLTLRRSVLFVLFDAEEKGLLGSRYFINHPPVPLERIVAMINLDMIGHGEKGSCIVSGVGTAKAWPAILREAEAGEPLTFRHLDSGPGGSDHLSFLGKKIPILFFCTGMHRYYHTPDDDAETIDAEGAVTILRVVLRTLIETANRTERPSFKKAGPPRGKLHV